MRALTLCQAVDEAYNRHTDVDGLSGALADCIGDLYSSVFVIAGPGENDLCLS